jgi:proline dehydrogenase
MGVMRSVLLAGSQSGWLRDHAPRYAFVRRAVARFMPGEELDDMLRTAAVLRAQGIDAVFTRLGENVTDPAEADAVAHHYRAAMARVHAERAACEPSIKLTQLGLDFDPERCARHACALAEQAHDLGSYLWIDMEQSSYVDATLSMLRRVRARVPNVGVCLQAYLRRTATDIRDVMQAGCGVRLVKGAYREPPTVAYPKKRDVDEQFYRLAESMLAPPSRSTGARVVFGTHDMTLVARIRTHARQAVVPDTGYEFHMLYGIQRSAQVALVADGARVRVLIAYGPYWFPWYMRRLAERPANVWFVVRNLVAG